MNLAEIYPFLPGPAQTLALNFHAFRIHRERFGREFHAELARFLERERLPMDQIVDYQTARLRELIDHAYATVPYYRQVMDSRRLKPADIRTPGDLPKLPLLTRETVRTQLPELLSSSFRRSQLIHGHTSGTTGSPLQFYWDRRTCLVNNVADWRQKTWAGLSYGSPYAVLLGRTIVPPGQKKPPFWRMNYLHNQLWLSSFHLTPANMPSYVQKLKSFRPIAIEAYPSALYLFARHLEATHDSIPLRAALTTSETLLPNQRELIEKVFQCRVFDFYAMAERIVFATECEQHEGHHVNLDYGILELVNEQGEPVGEGELGRIAGTSLHNRAMPFIRYLSDDVTRLRMKRCSCGRTFPVMADVTTKAEDIVVTPDGRYVVPSALTHPFKDLQNVLMSQIIQESLDELLVRIVRAEGYDEAQEVPLVASLKKRVGEEMNIRIEHVPGIERTPAGKFKWVLSKVPLDLG